MSYLSEAIKKIGIKDRYYTPPHVIDYIESGEGKLKAIYGNPHYKVRDYYKGGKVSTPPRLKVP